MAIGDSSSKMGARAVRSLSVPVPSYDGCLVNKFDGRGSNKQASCDVVDRP
jgi:hypothetical protein